jgi:hypothetical protein
MFQGFPGSWPKVRRARDGRDFHAVRVPENQAPVGRAFDSIPALVNQPMMVAAELHEVRELRLAAVGPVSDVMGIHKSMAVAAGKAAAAVTHSERPADRCGHRAGAATDGEDLPMSSVNDRDKTGLTAQAFERCGRQSRCIGIFQRLRR